MIVATVVDGLAIWDGRIVSEAVLSSWFNTAHHSGHDPIAPLDQQHRKIEGLRFSMDHVARPSKLLPLKVELIA